MAQDTYIWKAGDGTTLLLNDLTHYVEQPSDGFGLPPLDVITRPIPEGNGSQWVATLARERKLTLNFVVRAPDWPTQLERRRELGAALNPLLGKGTLEILYQNGWARAIDGFVSDSSLRFDAGSTLGMARKEKVILTCPDVWWYDPAPVTGSFPYLTQTGGLTLPLTLPATLGGNSNPCQITVQNTGSVPSYPIFKIPGPAWNPTIWNVGTGQYVRWVGTVVAGATLTIDHTFLNPNLTLVDPYGQSRPAWGGVVGHLDPNSTLFAITGPAVTTLSYSQDNLARVLPTYTFYSRFVGV